MLSAACRSDAHGDPAEQLQAIDPLEYGGKNVAAYTLREEGQ